MKGVIDYDALLNPAPCHGDYATTLAPPTSASQGSDWSDASSQSSDDSPNSTSSTVSAASSQSTTCDSFCHARQGRAADNKPAITLPSPPNRVGCRQSSDAPVATELRQNPRRSASRTGCPPKLVHQQDRKVNFVDSLVDAAALMVEAVWPLSSVQCRSELSNKVVLPLRTFIQETLKRSRTSYSTLQVTMYYLVLIKGHVPKHDFTMEQPNDLHASRALQCGRRIFLAALILASKYLQDRNYSARAWSRISGLNTLEIYQNETAFLLAVNWNLHITDTIWQRWTKILLNYRPPPTPPGPGSVCTFYLQQCHEWKRAMLQLDANLTNTEALLPFARSPTLTVEVSSPIGFESSELPLTPMVLEPTPNPITVHTPCRNVPALGLLPTPKLTPQLGGFGTPAVGVVPPMLGKCSALGAALSQAGSHSQFLDRWPTSTTSSPQSYQPSRRSSLAYSTASSPESMISDVSRSSRSSSISSASSLVSATSLNGKLGIPSRFRFAKLQTEKPLLRPVIIPSISEDFEQSCLTSSPDSYTGPVGKLADMTMETTLARRERDLEEMARESANDAARTLQEMHHGYITPTETPAPVRAGSKRSRSNSLEASLLQENVREILSGRSQCRDGAGWSDGMLRTRFSNPEIRQTLQIPVPVPTLSSTGSKRLCCSAEMSQELGCNYLHPGMAGVGGPGMWANILRE